jgi:hypothetical protein
LTCGHSTTLHPSRVPPIASWPLPRTLRAEQDQKRNVGYYQSKKMGIETQVAASDFGQVIEESHRWLGEFINRQR